MGGGQVTVKTSNGAYDFRVSATVAAKLKSGTLVPFSVGSSAFGNYYVGRIYRHVVVPTAAVDAKIAALKKAGCKNIHVYPDTDMVLILY